MAVESVPTEGSSVSSSASSVLSPSFAIVVESGSFSRKNKDGETTAGTRLSMKIGKRSWSKTDRVRFLINDKFRRIKEGSMKGASIGGSKSFHRNG